MKQSQWKSLSWTWNWAKCVTLLASRLIGVRGKQLREKLLGEAEMTLEWAVQLCQVKEATQNHMGAMNSGAAAECECVVETVGRENSIVNRGKPTSGRSKVRGTSKQSHTKSREHHSCDNVEVNMSHTNVLQMENTEEPARRKITLHASAGSRGNTRQFTVSRTMTLKAATGRWAISS